MVDLTVGQIIDHIEKGDDLGKKFVKVHMSMLRLLVKEDCDG